MDAPAAQRGMLGPVVPLTPRLPTTAEPEPSPTVGPPAGYRSVQLTEGEVDEVVEVDSLAFATPGGEPAPIPLEWPRTAGMRSESGQLAAIRSSYAFDLPVPGGRVPAAGLTWVGVHPSHRRRGLLRAMLAEHLTRTAARGEPLSVLTASEPAIYGRFGYGCAVPAVDVTLRRGAVLREVPGSGDLTTALTTADASRHTDVVEQVHRAAGAAGVGRPGWVSRPTEVLRAQKFHDPASSRDGAEPLRLLTVTDPSGVVRGCALFARTQRPAGIGAMTVAVREVAAVDAASTRALWAALLDLDLTTTVTARRLAPDDGLLHLLLDARAAAPVVLDHVWVRLVDVPAALAARRYSADVDVVLDVTDDLVPASAGRWHLRGGPASALVRRTAAGARPADLALHVRDLGAAYLGGVSLAALAGAGLVTELTPGSLAAASTAFGWPLAPACSWGF